MGWLSCSILSIIFITFDYTRAETCPPRMNCALRLSCGASPSIVSVYNVETKMGSIIDTDNDLSLVFDGMAGIKILYDHERSIGIRVTHKVAIWDDTQSTIAQYVQSIGSLREVSAYESTSHASGYFQISSAPDDIISAHRKIVETLEPELADFAEYKKSDIIMISVNLFEELCRMRQHRLHQFFDSKFRLNDSFVYGGLISVVSTFRGLSSLLKESQGAIENFIMKPTFDLQPIFMSECGSESLARIVEQINQLDLSIWQNLRYPSVLYKIIREFDGGLYKGLRGIEALVFHLIQFTQSKVSLEVLIDVLIQVAASIKEVTWSLIVQKVEFIERVLSTKLPPALSENLLYYFKAFLDHKLIINNINICDIVKKYLVGSSFGLSTVIGILHEMKTNFFGALNVLLNRIAFFIMSGQGPFYIFRLIPKLKEMIDVQSGISPLLQITNFLNPKVLPQVFTGNTIENMIRAIPIIGDVFDEILRVLANLHEKKESWLSELLQAGSYENLLGWLKYGMGITGGVKPVGCVHEMGLWGLDRSGCTCWS